MLFLRELAKALAWGIVASLVIVGAGYTVYWFIFEDDLTVSDGACNIAVLSISGDIVPYEQSMTDEWGDTVLLGTDPDSFSRFLRYAEDDWLIEGVLVRIDSGGGAPVASEIMMRALKRSTLPSVALIRESGASGAYLAATGADTIIASESSDVGSIGVTMSYLDTVRENDSLGLTFNELSSAPFKDYMNPNKELTDEERALLERDLAIWHEVFVRQVSENRNLPYERVVALADGSSVPGALAKEAGLVDAIGDQETARQWFAEQLGLDTSEVVFCE